MSNKTQSDVVSQVSEFIGRYLQCSEHQRTVLALWVLHTYCFPAAQVTPYLYIRSAHKQSGKTLCLQLFALLCEGSALTSGVFKASDLALPMPAKPISALLLDECHATIGTRSRSKGPTLRGLLAGSFHLLHGHGNIAQERNAFCPKAFAGFGPLPEDLADRSIPIILEPLKVPSSLNAEPGTPTQKTFCASSETRAHLPSNFDDFANHLVPCPLFPVPSPSALISATPLTRSSPSETASIIGLTCTCCPFCINCRPCPVPPFPPTSHLASRTSSSLSSKSPACSAAPGRAVPSKPSLSSSTSKPASISSPTCNSWPTSATASPITAIPNASPPPPCWTGCTPSRRAPGLQSTMQTAHLRPTS